MASSNPRAVGNDTGALHRQVMLLHSSATVHRTVCMLPHPHNPKPFFLTMICPHTHRKCLATHAFTHSLRSLAHLSAPLAHRRMPWTPPSLRSQPSRSGRLVVPVGQGPRVRGVPSAPSPRQQGRVRGRGGWGGGRSRTTTSTRAGMGVARSFRTMMTVTASVLTETTGTTGAARCRARPGIAKAP